MTATDCLAVCCHGDAAAPEGDRDPAWLTCAIAAGAALPYNLLILGPTKSGAPHSPFALIRLMAGSLAIARCAGSRRLLYNGPTVRLSCFLPAVCLRKCTFDKRTHQQRFSVVGPSCRLLQ
jgi:hypothetical protein